MYRSRFQREQVQHRRCTRPGCDRDAVARLTYDIVSCQVWLDGLEGSRTRTETLCQLHLDRLTIPRGWALSDRRVDTHRVVTNPVATEIDDHRTTSASHAHVDGDYEDAGEEKHRVESNDDDVSKKSRRSDESATDEDELHDDAIPQELRAGSPLLSRAFRAAGGSKSLVEDTVNPPLRLPDSDS